MRVPSRVGALVVTLAVAAGLNACTSDGEAPRAETTTETTFARPTAIPGGRSEGENLRLGARPVTDSPFETLMRIGQRRGDTSQLLEGLSDRGEQLLSRSVPGKGLELVSSTLLIRDLDGRETVLPMPAREVPRQITNAVIDEDFVVWMESPGTELSVQDWAMFAYDRASGRTEQIARAPRMPGGAAPPPPPGYTGPVLAGGQVFWAQVGGRTGRESVGIFGCAIDDCRPTLVAPAAAYPAVWAGGLYYIGMERFQGLRGAQYEDEMTVERRDLATSKVEVLAAVPLTRASPFGLAVGDGRAVWILSGDESRAMIHDFTSGVETEVTAERGHGFGYPVAGDGFVAWAESSGNAEAQLGGYVDVEGSGLFEIGNTSGLYLVEAAGRFLAWQESSTPAAKPEDIAVVLAELG